MQGAKPITDEQVKLVLNSFDGIYRLRNKCLFILGLKTGFRISELLSLLISDVYQFDKVVDNITVRRKNMKGRNGGRTIPLHKDAKEILSEYLNSLPDYIIENKKSFLFQSNKKGDHPINRQQAWNLLKKQFDKNRIPFTGTHSMRKTFAKTMYDRLDGNIFKIKEAMGHKSVNSTVSYLSFKQDEINNAILGGD